MGILFSSFPIRGIDVSQFNGTIDWTKVQSNFAAIRTGYGVTLDTRFTTNWTNARGKVNRFAYWYMDYYSNHNAGSNVNGMSDTDWGVLQAETCWANLKNDPEGITFLDIESANPSFSPSISTVAARAQAIAKAFLERLDSLSGKFNGIYCSLGLLNWFGAWFKNRPLWVAWYNESQTPTSVLNAVSKTGWTGKCYIWQYTSDGDIDNNGSGDGVAMGMQYSDLDLNAWLGTTADYSAFFSGYSTPTPVEEQPLYKVKILIYNLTVRTGPGVLYSRLRRADFPGTYNIYEEKSGFGRISTTASEWISLSPEFVLKLSDDDSETDPPDEIEPTVLYTVKILIYNLMVRTGPGLTYSRLRRANFPGEYNIYEEKNGYGRISATVSEWISLSPDYVRKLSDDETDDTDTPTDDDASILYHVKILIYNLSVRSGPGILYKWIRRANFPGEYGIYEVKNGYGRISKTSSEWISLSTKYVLKLDSKSMLTDEDILMKLWAAHPELH